MLAKTTVVALATALALLTASLGPIPAAALPIAENNIRKNDNNNHCSDNYDEYEPVPISAVPSRVMTRTTQVPHFNLPTPAAPSPSPYRYYGDYDYAPYDSPVANPIPARTTSVWDGIATGWYYPTDSSSRGGQAVPTWIAPMPTWNAGAPRGPHPPLATTKSAFLRTTTHWYGHGGGAVYSRITSAGGNYPPPMPTRTPYRYNGGNNGGAQQRPFGVDQQNSTRFEGENGTYNDNNDLDTLVEYEYEEHAPLSPTATFAPRPTSTLSLSSFEFEDDEGYEKNETDAEYCHPSGRTQRYIGVDLREDSFAVGYVNSAGKVVLIPNEKGELYSPTSVRFLDGGPRALVGLAALDNAQEQTTKLRKDSVVDLSSSEVLYEAFPQNVLLSLERDSVKDGDRKMWYMQGGYNAELLAVVLRRAMDMAERHESFSSWSGEKVRGVVITVQDPSNDVEDVSYMYGRHIARQPWVMSHVANIVQTDMIDAYPETLSLAAAHIEFFESRVQRDPLGGEDAYLPQTVLFYNLRDTTEDMTVMQYQKGTFGLRPFHLKFLGGYLYHEDGLIQDEFESYATKNLVNQFYQMLSELPDSEAILEYNKIESVDKTEFRRVAEFMDTLLNKATDAERFSLTELKLGPHEAITVSLSMWKGIRLEFLKERLSKAVDRVLASSGLESKDMVDHLVVADVTSFKGQSTAAMEAVFGEEGKKKIVKAVDPLRAVAEGIATIAGLLTKESPLQVPWYCPSYQP